MLPDLAMPHPQEKLLGDAMLCAMRLCYGYRGYESAEKAKVALRRRCRGIARPQLEEAFSQGVALYNRAEQAVWANRDRSAAEGFGDLEAQLLQEFPTAGAATIRDALSWARYWRILR